MLLATVLALIHLSSSNCARKICLLWTTKWTLDVIKWLTWSLKSSNDHMTQLKPIKSHLQDMNWCYSWKYSFANLNTQPDFVPNIWKDYDEERNTEKETSESKKQPFVTCALWLKPILYEMLLLREVIPLLLFPWLRWWGRGAECYLHVFYYQERLCYVFLTGSGHQLIYRELRGNPGQRKEYLDSATGGISIGLYCCPLFFIGSVSECKFSSVWVVRLTMWSWFAWQESQFSVIGLLGDFT